METKSHKEIFTQIYKDDVWGGSGGGSSPEATVEYRNYLQRFLKEKNIKTVIDFGCGDWTFSNKINWHGISYLGIDCVESVIKKNKKLYQKNNVAFECSEYAPHGADLLILKDVLQHWDNYLEIQGFMKSVNNQFKYILITNSSELFHLHTVKNFDPEIVLQTNNNDPKETLLITNI